MSVLVTQTVVAAVNTGAASLRAGQSVASAVVRNAATIRAAQSVLSVLVPAPQPIAVATWDGIRL